MDRRIVLLRGINLGSRNRVAMPELREVLGGAGDANVGTYLQSGNVVLDSDEPPAKLERALERLINDRFGLDIPVITRTRGELAEVIQRNPLGDIVTNPKLYQVTFLAEPLEPARTAELGSLAAGSEQLVALGRELYAWHPDGIARSKLSSKLAGRGLGVKATARNWSTVLALMEMAGE